MFEMTPWGAAAKLVSLKDEDGIEVYVVPNLDPMAERPWAAVMKDLDLQELVLRSRRSEFHVSQEVRAAYEERQNYYTVAEALNKANEWTSGWVAAVRQEEDEADA